jgi:hypothetical protein
VHDTGRVRGGQPAEDALDDVQRLARAQPAALGQQLAQRPAGHVFHRQEQDLAVCALVVDGNHVRAGQPGHRPGLLDEPADEVSVMSQLRVGDLERDRALEPRVRPEVDGGHPAARDPGVHPVASVEQLPDRQARQGRIHQDESIGAVSSPPR